MDGSRFTSVLLPPRVTFGEVRDGQQVESLHHRAHERCFIASSVSSGALEASSVWSASLTA